MPGMSIAGPCDPHIARNPYREAQIGSAVVASMVSMTKAEFL
jgi:hypothetical protein